MILIYSIDAWFIHHLLLNCYINQCSSNFCGYQTTAFSKEKNDRYKTDNHLLKQKKKKASMSQITN